MIRGGFGYVFGLVIGSALYNICIRAVPFVFRVTLEKKAAHILSLKVLRE